MWIRKGEIKLKENGGRRVQKLRKRDEKWRKELIDW